MALILVRGNHLFSLDDGLGQDLRPEGSSTAMMSDAMGKQLKAVRVNSDGSEFGPSLSLDLAAGFSVAIYSVTKDKDEETVSSLELIKREMDEIKGSRSLYDVLQLVFDEIQPR